jgi:hypothetical protein
VDIAILPSEVPAFWGERNFAIVDALVGFEDWFPLHSKSPAGKDK